MLRMDLAPFLDPNIVPASRTHPVLRMDLAHFLTNIIPAATNYPVLLIEIALLLDPNIAVHEINDQVVRSDLASLLLPYTTALNMLSSLPHCSV